jgi:Pyruvate/2-oxoacid:ferredoxin oxidoreductase delta subunit
VKELKMATRKIVEIDDAKCNGCGLCVPSCAEGAIQIRDGKARLVADVYCDGLGACLGECPQDAIRVIEREAVDFDEEAAKRHVAALRAAPPEKQLPCGCPGSAVRNLQLDVLATPGKSVDTSRRAPGVSPGIDEPSTPHPRVDAQGSPLPAEPSALGNWPVQLRLVPPNAPFLRGADLLLVADCVPFALADFHRRFLAGRPVVIGCPKLDDGQQYVEKLAAILTASGVKSLTVLHMEVPCCTGLVRIAQAAKQAAGSDVPLRDTTISIRGQVL